MPKLQEVTLPRYCLIGHFDNEEDKARREREVQRLLEDKFSGYIRIPKTKDGYLKFGKESAGCDRVNIKVHDLILRNKIVVAKLYKPNK